MITSPSPKNAAHDAAQHDHSAVQHEGKPSERLMVGPRPLPLFLELVKMVAVRDPQTARNALEGLRKVQGLPPLKTRPDRAALMMSESTLLRDYGGTGPLVVFVPSLINPPTILDISESRSLLGWLATQGVHPLLVDWGPVSGAQRDMSISDYITKVLVPLLQDLGEPAHLVGYCLGGTMAMAASQLAPVLSLALIATPWHFSKYSDASRMALDALWATMHPTAEAMGLLPIESLQAMFWSLDPDGTVAKYARFATMNMPQDEIALFQAMEGWANSGEPLPLAAARELFEDFIAADIPGAGRWICDGRIISPQSLSCPALDIVSTTDRIVPAITASGISNRLELDRGHVGMVTGSQAHAQLWMPLRDWLLHLHKS